MEVQVAQNFRETYAFATGYAHAKHLIPHSKIRQPTQDGIQTTAGYIRSAGWIPTSVLYVQEADPPARQPAANDNDNDTPPPPKLEELVQASRNEGQGRDGIEIRQNEKYTYLSDVTEVGYDRRWFHIIDGAHRAAAALIVAEEWRQAGREEDAERLLKVPVIVMSGGMPIHRMAQFANMLNVSNENFIVTSNMDQMTGLKRSHSLWLEHVVAPAVKAIQAKEREDQIPEKSRLTPWDLDQMRGDPSWVAYATAEAEACNRTLKQVYGRDHRTLQVWIATAKYMSDEVLAHFRTLYDADVST